MANTDKPNDIDKTVILSDEKTPATAPVLEQILEGINALREEVATLREAVATLTADQARANKEAATNFTRLADGMQVLVNELFQRRVDIQGVQNRLDELERQAS